MRSSSVRLSILATLVAAWAWSPAAHVEAQSCAGGTPDGFYVNPPELCDDNNVVNGDGCTSSCAIESGWLCAPPVDFVGLTTLDYGTDAAWTISADGLAGTQTVNTSAPTIALFGANAMGTTYTFDLSVDTLTDDDFIGFVLGFDPGDITSPTADYLLIDWKQAAQSNGGCNGAAGMALSRVTGVPASLLSAFWCHNTPAGPGPGVREIQRATGAFGTTGWVDLAVYRFTITYTPTRVLVTVQSRTPVPGAVVTVFDLAPPAGQTWPTGQLGFYGLSQERVTYRVIGPRGPSTCNRPPVAPDASVVTTNGPGVRCVSAITGVTDPDGNPIDAASVRAIAPLPAGVTITDPSSGAAPGLICLDLATDTATGDFAVPYRVCDNVLRPNACDTGVLTVRFNDSPTLVVAPRDVLGGMDSQTLASIQTSSSQGAVATGWDTTSASVATTGAGTFGATAASTLGGTCAIVAGSVVYTAPAAITASSDSCVLRLCEQQPGPLGTSATGRACGTVTITYRLDTDGDGIPNLVEGSSDFDEDGLADYRDLDADDDGVPDAIERGADGTMPRNTDGGLLADYLDRDSDGDGLTDSFEAGGLDANADGRLDAFVDADGDGLHDAVDPSCGAGCTPGVALPLPDTDGDGDANLIDTDSDADGVSDVVESRDVNGDGIPDIAATGLDADNDGIDDAYDGVVSGGLDLDLDGIRDEADDDDDGDGIRSILEDVNGTGGVRDDDSDADGTPNYRDRDDDGDGVLTRFERADPNGDRDPADARNSDGDALADYLDPDDDGDGVPTRFEQADVDANGDPSDAENTDGDTLADYLDPDDDGDGIDTRYEAADPNADGDPSDARNTNAAGETTAGVPLVPDYLDPDDDGDGVATDLEAPDADDDGNPSDARNTDADGAADYLDDDDDGDGIDTSIEIADGAALPTPNDDVDGNGTPNRLDTDSDGDGVLDSAEGRDDLDGDDVPNYLDPDSAPRDSDGDGIADHVECLPGTVPAECPDSDGDGMFDWMDSDDDGDGVPTLEETPRGDSDTDGTPNHLDPDDDGDGLPTRDERPGDTDRDTDSDGTADHLDPDDDGDGISTEDERTDGMTHGNDVDADGDPNWLDTDSDMDGSSDMGECPGGTACPDDDGDDVPDYLDDDVQPEDTDGDGVPDSVECATTPCRDTDGDGTPDREDTDDDGDGILTRDERPMGLDRDSDDDGTPDYLDPDDDGDGIPTRDERPSSSDRDTDDDGTADHLDPDDDGDSIPTSVERMDGTTFGNDVDEDGMPNWLDTDSDGDGSSDSDEGRDDDDGDGTPNYLDPSGTTGPTEGGLTGGALCSVSAPGAGHGAGWLALAVVGLALMLRRRRAGLVALALAFVVVAAPASLSAQAVQLDQYRPAQLANDGFSVSRAQDLGHLEVGAMLQLDYGLNPLVWETMRGDASSESVHVVEHQLVGHVGLALGLFDRLVLFAGLPVSLLMEGDDTDAIAVSPAEGTSLGDAHAGARLRLVGEPGEVFALALQATVALPTAQWATRSQRYSGEDGATVSPEIIAEVRGGGVWLAANVGGRFRATDRARFDNLEISHELTWGVALGIPIVGDIFTAHVEAYGSTSFQYFGERETSPIEAIAGLRVQPVRGLHLGLAAGPGLTRGYGSPDLRGVFTVGWAPTREAAAPVEELPPVRSDRDGDGKYDDEDNCPDQPEDVDTYQDDDGCPDPDNDGDGVLDVDDGAPMEPEDADGFEDTDGVPDPDNDRDGILDGADNCRDEPEDADGFQDADGCPEPDNDRDTVLDGVDRCPLDPGLPADDGCPRAVRVDRETGTIYILQRVEFATNRDVILASSFPVLEEVRAVLDANPTLTTIRVEGHTDSRGRDIRNLELSRNRARSVLRWLIEHGIPAERLEGWGCGELHPAETNATNEGRQANRRVEFHIIAPAPAGGARVLEGCLPSEM